MLMARRTFCTGLGASLIAAPAIVRAASLMPVRLISYFNMRVLTDYVAGPVAPLEIYYGKIRLGPQALSWDAPLLCA